MGDFLYVEKADMHYMYGSAKGNDRAALRMYHMCKFPDRRMPDHRIIQRLHHQNFVKLVRSTSPDMMLVNEELPLCTDVRIYLNATFETRWIGRGGPVLWPPRSLNLSSLGYFLWGNLKNLVYATPFDQEEDLVARISEATANVHEIPGIFGL
ncbi:uncharacterized protein TNCV_3587681 [Trichonephila clavipes]|nr:uncharacterized protein TNCV_3587681 [Trichonephila clavipes]